MQFNSIIEKAQKLGLDVSGVNKNEILHHIAEQVGVNDLEELNQVLDNRLNESNVDSISNNNELLSDNIEDFEGTNSKIRNEKFGQKEYDQAKNKDGIYDKNHYKNKQKNLDEKVENLNNERHQSWKMKNGEKGPVKADGSNTTNKTWKDKVRDNANYAKARQDSISNKLNNAKASAYNMMHPEEALKDKAKSVAKNATKDIGKKATRSVANTGKAIGKATINGLSAIISFIISNPIVLIIIGVTIFILCLIFLFGGTGDGGESLGYCNKNCDGLSMKQTSLSKSEFVTKLKEYFSSSSESYKRVFADNAGIIYDVAKSEGVNPELVVIRAISEGFSPASTCGSSSNNYWGMGCYNGAGCSACIQYASFEDGVRGYVQNISQYETATDMMSKYAYIGDYWYNPGDSGNGGCYYYEYIKEYLSSSRSNEVASICSSGKTCTTSGGSLCTATTEEDQKAYATWQVQSMLEIRKNVFGIESDQCNTSCYNGDYTINPNDEIYSGLQLLHDKSFENLLSENGSSVEKFDELIKSSVEKSGVGTRDGVVAAATTLIGSLAQMGYKLNYQWGGKYYQIGTNPEWGMKADMSWLCDNYASSGYTKSKCTTNYQWNSFDCSGFVNWALINGMQDTSVPTQYTDTSGGTALSSNKAVCKSGGVLVSSGHIVLVVGIDDETKKYIVAESTGSDISSNTGGVKLSYYSYDASGYVCKNLDDVYND